MRPATTRRVRFAQTPTAPARPRPETRHSDDDDDVADLRDALHPVLQWDLDAVRWLVQLRETTPWLHALVVATTSKIRTQDFSLILWLIFLVMVPELGLPYFWIGIGNLLTVLVLQYLARVLRPVDLDPKLQSLVASIDPDTYGFPCVDAHMTIVVLVPVAAHSSSPIAHIAFSAIGVYLSATRLLLGARFVSQIVTSWLTGLTGLVLGNHGHIVVNAYRLGSGANTAAIVSLVALLMVVVGQWVESNDSRIVGVPKADFMAVLTNILQSDGAASSSGSNSPPNPRDPRVHQLPEDDEEEEEEEEVQGKRDSFYYLLRSMRARARQEVLM